MWNYDFMKEVVVMTGFMFIIMLDIWGIGYWVVKLVKWIWKKLHKKKDEEAASDCLQETRNDEPKGGAEVTS